MAYYNVIESIEPRIVQNLGELKAYIDEISLRLPEDTPIKARFDHAIEVKPMEENTTKHKALHISECDEISFPQWLAAANSIGYERGFEEPAVDALNEEGHTTEHLQEMHRDGYGPEEVFDLL